MKKDKQTKMCTSANPETPINNNPVRAQVIELKSIEEITSKILSQKNYDSIAADQFVAYVTVTNRLTLEFLLIMSTRFALDALRLAKEKGESINFMKIKLEFWADHFLLLHELNRVNLNLNRVQYWLPKEYKINQEFLIEYMKNMEKRQYEDSLPRQITASTITELMSNHQEATFYAYIINKYPFVTKERSPQITILDHILRLFNNKEINLSWSEYRAFIAKNNKNFYEF